MNWRPSCYGAAGTLLLVAAWEFAGRMHILGRTLPALSSVLAVYGQGFRLALLERSAAATLSSAATGLMLGATAGMLVALAAHLKPALRVGLDRLAVLVNGLPVIALGPILIITMGRQLTPTALATVPSFFVMYMAASTGLRQAADARLSQYLKTLGASRMQQMLLLEAPSAIPAVVGGLKLAVGGAMIGAIVGEWFGAPSGLGIVVLNSMQNFQIPLMWAAVLVIAAISLGSYAVLSVLERTVERRLR